MKRPIVLLTAFSVCVLLVAGAAAQDFKPAAYPPLQIGSQAAQNRIEIFNDFQCPASAASFMQHKAFAQRHPDDVLITFRNFPLRQHKNALAAAKAVEAASLQGKFLEMMTMIYENQEKWKESDTAADVFTDYAKTLEMDVDRFTTDLQGQTAIDRINFDIERAKLLGVNGTPWVFLNDHPFSGDLETTLFKSK